MRSSAARAAGTLGVLALLPFAPFWARGLGSIWGDLFYIHRPWRVFDAQCLQAGRLPLWDPYLYFGMPGAATMQDSLYYPLTTPFFLFSFPTATALFQLMHYWLAGALAYLCLRRFGARHGAALVGALLYALGGVMISNQGYLNHLALLSLWPGALALISAPSLCALALSLAFLAGYPPFWLGVAATTLGAAWYAKGPRRALSAAVLVPLLSAVLLLPGAELVRHSRRAAGVGLEEALTFGLTPGDLLQWVNPLLSAGRFDPNVDWFKTCYLGVVGAALALFGLSALPRRRAALLCAAAAFIVFLSLGGSTAWSRKLWEVLPPLKFVRYPGNLAYLALPLFCAAAAAGASRARPRLRAGLFVLAAAELVVLGWLGFNPAPRSVWLRRGELAGTLQKTLDGGRYLLSPTALHAHVGRGWTDWADRLYGLSSAVYRLPSGGNFGEPLVPSDDYALLDRLYSSKPDEAARLLPWTGTTALLSPKPLLGVPGLRYEGEALWSLHRVIGPPSPVRAAWLSRSDGELLPAGPEPPPARVKPAPLPVVSAREDRFSVEGETPAGWAYLAEPRFPGWKAYLETELGPGLAAPVPALGPFQRVAVPAGRWTLTWVYAPRSFSVGLWLSLLAAASLFFAGTRALRRLA